MGRLWVHQTYLFRHIWTWNPATGVFTLYRLTNDFHVNKRIIDDVAIIQTKRLRNKIAGFTTHLMKRIERGPVRGISLRLQEEVSEAARNSACLWFCFQSLTSCFYYYRKERERWTSFQTNPRSRLPTSRSVTIRSLRIWLSPSRSDTLSLTTTRRESVEATELSAQVLGNSERLDCLSPFASTPFLPFFSW